MTKEPGCGCLRDLIAYALLDSLTRLQSSEMLIFDLHFMGQGELLLLTLQACTSSVLPSHLPKIALISSFSDCASVPVCFAWFLTKHITINLSTKNVISFHLSNWQTIGFYTLFNIGTAE